ncbi:hypothetical protein [Domibacillus iocasae]|uniref:Uncharacterized protein n=1 Tax=Domibacillus iocasae TaxID=1714016 RepID=A0A1E7DSU3_9BACI|nr:hypothetical protein [Domibacillus iocasae]OES46157.1 hypothetical protein BA724_16420 [Domibacillus iocasae]
MEQPEMRYDLKEVLIAGKGENIQFEKGELIVTSDGSRRSWEVELIGVGNDTTLEESILSSVSYLDIELKCRGDEEFKGAAIVSDYNVGSNGNDITLSGSGVLIGFTK